MSNTQTQKKQMSVVKKMMIALVGGLIVGFIFMFIRSSMLASGNEGTWDIINKILFQDITAADGTAALGLFYIIGQLFMRGPAGSHRAACTVLPEPCHVQHLQLHKAGPDRGAHGTRLRLLLRCGRFLRRSCGLCYEDGRTFQRRAAC